MEIIKNTKIDFIGKRKFSFIFSGILILVGLTAFFLILLGKANLGIDFVGGAMILGNFDEYVSVNDLRSALSAEGFGGADIQSVSGETVPHNSFIIRTKGESDIIGDSLLTDIIASRIKKRFPDNEFHIDSVDDIGGAVGKTLQEQARWAVIFALLGILVYIWIRFDFRFGVAATIATFHDVLAVLGIYFLLHKEISLLLMTALLTLAGYSLTDTVVVYDRIRENLKQFRKRGDFAGTVNASINEVLSRTIITTGTTLLAVLSLLIFGGEVLRDFSLALFFGILVGTYSSVFVASPVIVEWEKRSPRRFK
ncbi:MAG: protein translocase subunit SecF [candidate division Zixibacteria bacterium 4484_95]|nr:MAG: protein translocase subunit SecF [candidate division Zixibacteria bacterium 4484_95]